MSCRYLEKLTLVKEPRYRRLREHGLVPQVPRFRLGYSLNEVPAQSHLYISESELVPQKFVVIRHLLIVLAQTNVSQNVQQFQLPPSLMFRTAHKVEFLALPLLEVLTASRLQPCHL